MRPQIVRSLAAVAALGATALPGVSGIGAFGIAAAAEGEICRIPERVVEDDEKKPRRVPNIEPTTWKRLQQAQELITAEQYAEGVEILEAMVPRGDRRSRYNAAEMGQVHNLLGYAYWELNRAEKTIEHYEKVLEQVPNIAEATELLMLFQLAKIYFMQGQELEGDASRRWYNLSLTKMGEWIEKNADPGPDPYYFIAQIFYQFRDFTNGIKCLETTIHVARERGTQPKEPWWRMLQFMYYEQENWPKVEEILEILVRDFPKREYWVTLASVYGETNQEARQLLAMEAAHVGGFLDKETDLRAYGALLLQNETPNRASQQIKKGFDDEVIEVTAKNLQLLGQAYQASHDVEKAIEVFERSVEIEPEGKIYDLLAALYLDSDKFGECRTAAGKALEVGGLANRLRTQVTLGTCEFNLGSLAAARKTFTDVRRGARRDKDRRVERMAGDWINYIASEQKRRDELARVGL
ncbi:MAG: tetratricopeptide repeat protein [Gammaproteobacteria bacterium]|nr:tetratricopeptide repeat protein [Gammaproteobacteria bacterium]